MYEEQNIQVRDKTDTTINKPTYPIFILILLNDVLMLISQSWKKNAMNESKHETNLLFCGGGLKSLGYVGATYRCSYYCFGSSGTMCSPVKHLTLLKEELLSRMNWAGSVLRTYF